MTAKKVNSRECKLRVQAFHSRILTLCPHLHGNGVTFKRVISHSRPAFELASAKEGGERSRVS